MVLNLLNGQRQEIRNWIGVPQGAWMGPDGNWYSSALHNCWTDASWFFPAFTLQTILNDPTISIIYAGPDTLAGVAAVHLVLYRTLPGQSASSTVVIQRLSTVDLYLDASSGLPVGVKFKTHPDEDASLDIPVEIHFSNYKTITGVQTPMRVTKFLQNSLLLDLQVSEVQINSGLSDTNFAIPATLADASLLTKRIFLNTAGPRHPSSSRSKTVNRVKPTAHQSSASLAGGAR